MTVTYQQVLADAGAGGADQANAEAVLAEAIVHVEKYISDHLLDETIPVPDDVKDAAVLRCAVDLFARKKSPFGTQLLPDGSGQMIAQRLGADPLGGVYALLRPWVSRVGLG